MQNQRTKHISTVVWILLSSVLICSCSKNHDAFLVLTLKKQNRFLKEQLQLARSVMEVKVNGNPGMMPYYKLFRKQDSIAKNYIQTLSTDKAIIEHYKSFIQQSNAVFMNAQQGASTKLLLDDVPHTQFTFDSLLLKTESDSVKIALIEQEILQRYLTITQLYYSASSACGIRFDNPDYFGYRLTIEKNKDHFLLTLKCYDRKRIPYFEKLEFISMSRNDQKNDYYPEELTNIASHILGSGYADEAVVIKTDVLPKGLYKIHCKKLSISEAGRLVKQDAYYDFEITENQ